MTLYFKLSIVDQDFDDLRKPDKLIYSMAISLGDSLPPSVRKALQDAAARSIEEEEGILSPAMALALIGILGTGLVNRLTGGEEGHR